VADEHRKISEKFSIKGPGVVIYICTPRYLGGRGQEDHVSGQPGKKVWSWWCMPVIPATKET
jgi:hypothetical protein